MVVDASVLTDFLLGRPQALEALQRELAGHEHEPLHVPELVEPETLNALRRLALAGAVSDQRAIEAASDYQRGYRLARMWAAAAVALVALIAAAAPTSAVAHGSCGCLEPRMVPRREPVRITGGPGMGQAGGAGYPAYRVIFNPRPADLMVAPEYLASAYRADVPTTTVLSRPRREPTRRGTFRVPRVPPGLYMVLIFDGEEGGAHSTWDYLHVIDSEQPAQGVVVGRRPTPWRRASRTACAEAGRTTDPRRAGWR